MGEVIFICSVCKSKLILYEDPVYAEANGTHLCKNCFQKAYEGIVDTDPQPRDTKPDWFMDAYLKVFENPPWSEWKEDRPWHPPFDIIDYEAYMKKRRIKIGLSDT